MPRPRGDDRTSKPRVAGSGKGQWEGADASTRWAKYRIGYHLVWTAKYRRHILRDDVVKTLKSAISRACEQAGMTLIAMEADRDHESYYVGTVGDMSASTVRHYIENCQGQ